MVKKWNKIPLKNFGIILLCIMIWGLIYIPKVNAQKYIMTYLYGSGNYLEMIAERENNFNEVSPSYFDLNENGTLKLNSIDKNLVSEMKKQNIKVVPFLSNHWDREIGKKAVQNYETLSSQIAEAVEENSLDGVNVDIENLTEIDKENYINLVKRLREKMPIEKTLVVSVAANPAGINVGWQGSYDYNELAKFADYIMIMAYDEHYEGGTAGPVASIDFVEKSIQYAIKYVSKEKIILGIPLYGRVWNVNTGVGGAGVSLNKINEIAEKYDSIITFDEESKSPKALINIRSIDELPKIGGKTLSIGQYEFWYEDEESIKFKLDLIEKYDLKGVGMWKIGLETSSVWESIKEKIDKIVCKVFADVDANHWAYKYIELVSDKGIMIGKNESLFEPEASLSRGELATIIIRFIDSENINILSNNIDKKSFNDISGHWAENYILELQSYGIINGYENNEFRPDNKVTRAEVCAIINRVLKNTEKITKINTEANYNDVDSSHWAHQDIVKLSQDGVVQGYENGDFAPENTIKRCEIAKILQKICEKTA